MAAIPRGLFDIIIDNIVTALQAFSAEQVIEGGPSVGFNVARDRTRPPKMKELPLVVVWQDTNEPNGNGTTHSMSNDITRINIDCYTKGVDDDCDGLDETSAWSRLYYLQEQTRYALMRLVNKDFNLAVGSIGRKKWPRWQVFQNDLKLPETEVIAGRWTLEIEYSFFPEDIQGTALELISVDAQKWGAQYTFGGG